MTSTALLAAYTLLVGLGVPRLLRRARWPYRAPGLAVALWLGLMVSFSASLTLVVHHLVVPEAHLHRGVLGILHACGVAGTADLGTAVDSAQMAAPLVVALWPAGWFAAVVLRARRHRRRHGAMLDLVARREPGLAATVLDHGTPAVYCLPGRSRRIVLTSGALKALTPPQLQAVLAHERAHLSGRHHLVTGAADAFTRAYPGLPLAIGARAEIATLLEMVADDRAVLAHPPRTLAGAMCEVAAGQVPGFGLGAGGSTVVARVTRLLHPAKSPHPLARTSVAALALAAPMMPFLFACGSVAG
ncbi:M56 family metallopeptidase [Kitasatospora sp. NPDC058406]|uniref:M56 family metallopeptidase n=1 Tax=Kitasatospora sp. NPDC058406 TaxID=3346483 RepID=UPI00364F573C